MGTQLGVLFQNFGEPSKEVTRVDKVGHRGGEVEEVDALYSC